MDNITYRRVFYTVDNENPSQKYISVEMFDGSIKSVPLDPANRHYAEIMRQVEAGELTIQDADS